MAPHTQNSFILTRLVSTLIKTTALGSIRQSKKQFIFRHHKPRYAKYAPQNMVRQLLNHGHWSNHNKNTVTQSEGKRRRKWRRRRDSNPRSCYTQRFSRPPLSTTRPLLRFTKYGAGGRSRTVTGDAHHPLKMACLPIPPRRQLFCGLVRECLISWFYIGTF